MNSYLKSKLNNSYIINIYYLVLLPIIIYATYKNGYLPYQKELCGIYGLIKPLLLPITALLIGYLITYIYLKTTTKEDIIYKLKSSYNPLLSILLSLILPISTNYIIFILIILLFNYFLNKFNNTLNNVIIFKLIIVLILILLHNYTYQNIYELNIDTSYKTMDLFFGRSIGAIGTTNIFLCLISYFILLLIPSYKKEIPITILLSYIGLALVISLFGGSIKDALKLVLSNEIIFASIFIATIPLYSPVSLQYQRIYGLLIGVISYFTIKFISIHEGVYIAILLVNIIFILLNKYIIKKSV